jgi:TetR/AcrR family transcriptional repressor of bet genes
MASALRQLPEERRQALIEATIDSLKRYGHEGLSVRRICEQANVSIGLINHYFPRKDLLVAEGYRQLNAQLIEGIRRAVPPPPASPRTRLHALFTATFSPPNTDRGVLTAWIVFWSLHPHSKAIQRVHDETYAGHVRLLRTMLTELGREWGGLRMKPRLAAIGLNALLDGLWLESCLDPDNFTPREAIALCDAWVDSLLPVRNRG